VRGVAWFTQDDPIDRPLERFDGAITLYTGGARESYPSYVGGFLRSRRRLTACVRAAQV